MKNKIRSSEITPEALYTSRRRFIKSALKTATASILLISCSPKINSGDQLVTPDSNSSEVIEGLIAYIITALIIVHITLASKGDFIEPIILGGLFLFAMLWRISPLKNISIQNMPKWARDLNTFLIH